MAVVGKFLHFSKASTESGWTHGQATIMDTEIVKEVARKIEALDALAKLFKNLWYEQIRNDLCLNFMNVKLVSVGSGLHYADHGPTHHSTEDFGVLRVLPNIKIISPSGDYDTEVLTSLVSKDLGPAYIRLGRGKDTTNNYEPKIGKGVIIKSGDDLTIVTTGSGVNDSYSLTEKLENDDISVEIINIHTIKPLDKKIIIESVKKTNKVIVIEEHQETGGLGDAVASLIAKQKLQVDLITMGIEGKFCSYIGSYESIKNNSSKR